MLMLTRRAGEAIVLKVPGHPEITVRVMGIKGGQVRIGTAAPLDVSVVREELLDQPQKERA